METTTRLGSVGQRVAKEVARLRGRTTVRELSARLSKLGRPILPSGITKIEQGSRRVDVDDLVALALALEVTPTRLLLGPPPTDGSFDNPAHDEVWEKEEFGGEDGGRRFPVWFLRLVPNFAVEPWEVWAWAFGEMPFGEIWRLSDEQREIMFPDPERSEAEFRLENALPPVRVSLGHAEGVQEAMTSVDTAVQDALDEGLTEDQVRQIVNSSMTRWRKDENVKAQAEKRFQRHDPGAARTREQLGPDKGIPGESE
jgi:transcriptional regulator with XRE-family HTH domain